MSFAFGSETSEESRSDVFKRMVRLVVILVENFEMSLSFEGVEVSSGGGRHFFSS